MTALVWGARPNLSLSFVAPMVRVEAEGQDSRSGFADSRVFARYDLFRKDRVGGTTRLAPEIGIKLPTGGTFGNGSVDVSAGLIFSHIKDPNWFIADAQFTQTGEGDESFESGDSWRFDVAYLRRVFPRSGAGVPMVLAVLELSSERTGMARRGVLQLEDTGGRITTLSPGIEAVVSRSLVLEFSVPIAIDTDLNGQQAEPSVSGIVGFRWLF